jgi:hypothetical protein
VRPGHGSRSARMAWNRWWSPSSSPSPRVSAVSGPCASAAPTAGLRARTGLGAGRAGQVSAFDGLGRWRRDRLPEEKCRHGGKEGYAAMACAFAGRRPSSKQSRVGGSTGANHRDRRFTGILESGLVRRWRALFRWPAWGPLGGCRTCIRGRKGSVVGDESRLVPLGEFVSGLPQELRSAQAARDPDCSSR